LFQREHTCTQGTTPNKLKSPSFEAAHAQVKTIFLMIEIVDEMQPSHSYLGVTKDFK
jgi:hypothetical protein